MPRRVGSPKASVIADTAAVNPDPSARAVRRIHRARSGSTRPDPLEPCPVFYLSDSGNSTESAAPHPCPLDRADSSTRCARSRTPSCTARSSTSAWCAASTSRPDGVGRRAASPSPSPAARCATRSSNRVTGALTPLDGRHAASTLDFTVMTDQEREALRDQAAGHHGHAAHGHGPAQGHAQGRPVPFTQPGSKTRPLLISSGKGGVGKSAVTTNLAVALAAHGHSRRRRRRRHLRLLDPPHARRRRRPGGHRRDAAAVRVVGRAVHLDRLLRARGPGGDLARSDAAQGARAVPRRRLLGRPRLPARRHAPGHRRHRHLAQPVPAPRRGVRRHHAAARPRRRSPGCRRRWRRRSTSPCAASSRTCRGSPATTASATSCSARGGGAGVGRRARRPAADAASRWCRRCVPAATTVDRSPPPTRTARRGGRSTSWPSASPTTCDRARCSATRCASSESTRRPAARNERSVGSRP